MRKAARYFSGVSLCTCLIFFYFEKFKLSGESMSESARVLKVFQQTRTVCFGRFLIDVPAESEVVYGPAEVPYPVLVYPGKSADMENMIEKKLVEIDKDRPNVYDALAKADSMVGKVINGNVPKQKLVFGISPASFAFYNIISYARVGDDVFIQEAEAMSSASKYSTIVQQLNSMASLFLSRSDELIPPEAGICIENGFIRDAGHPMYERISLGVRLSSHPDVHLSLSTTNKDILVPSDALEPRVKQGEQLLLANGDGAWYAQLKKIRQGQRKIGNWQGYEFLARMPSQERAGESHEFAFVSQGEPNNPYLPLLDVELQSGVKDNKVGRVKPSVTDEEAVMIWDRITSSIRVRPHQ